MAGRKSKRGSGGEGEHENSERWLLTYADMITLLVAFFIMLYAMSVMSQAKFQQLALSVRSGFGSSMIGGVPTPFSRGGGTNGVPSILSSSWQEHSPSEDQFPKIGHPGESNLDADRLDKVYQTLQAFIQKRKLKKLMQVTQAQRGVVVTVLTDHALFQSGEADLRSEEIGLLDKVASVIGAIPNGVRVEGHTDSLPIHTARFPTNWELSTTRATTVLRYLAAHDVSPRRLEAAGYADQHPLGPNNTDEERAKNRRVEIVVLRQTDGTD